MQFTKTFQLLKLLFSGTVSFHNSRKTIKYKGDDVLGALCIFLLIACYHDYRYRKIPNVLLIVMLIVGVLKSLWNPENENLVSCLTVIIMVVAFLYPFFRVGALGAGDVKLFGICAAYLSSDRVLSFIFVSLLVAAVISLIILLTKRCIKEFRRIKIPLAGPVLCSVLLYMGGVY